MKINRIIINYLIGLCFLMVSPTYAQDWTMQNIAGTGDNSFAPNMNPLETGFNNPAAMAVDSKGNIYFIVVGDFKIYKIENDTLKVFHDETATGNFLNGLAIDSQDNVYYTFSQTSATAGYYDRRYYIWKKDQEGYQNHIAGFEGTEGFPPLDGASAGSYPIGKAAGLRIRKVPDGSGGFTEYLYYSGKGETQSFIQKIDLTDDSHPTFRVAGNNEPAPAEITEGVYALGVPVNVGLGFAWDSAGNLYYGTNNDRINRINASDQTIHFFAGNGTGGYIEDNVDAKNTRLDLSTSGFLITTLNGKEVMLICDTENNRIRKIELATEEGQPNIITTICGSGFEEGEIGHAAGNLEGATAKLALEANIKPFDILQIGDSIYFSDDAKRIRKAFLCTNPVINSVSISDEVICKGDEITLEAKGLLGDATLWNWFISSDCGTAAEAISHNPTLTVTVTENATYTVNATGGCALRDICTPVEIKLNCEEFYNTFTPNGDGKNDFLEINTVQNYPTNVVSIYNRWGRKINEIQNYDNATRVWNGNDDKDVTVDSGTYFFSLESEGQVILTGWVQIMN